MQACKAETGSCLHAVTSNPGCSYVKGWSLLRAFGWGAVALWSHGLTPAC
jgi:hypothetical protein